MDLKLRKTQLSTRPVRFLYKSVFDWLIGYWLFGTLAVYPSGLILSENFFFCIKPFGFFRVELRYNKTKVYNTSGALSMHLQPKHTWIRELSGALLFS